MVKNVYSEKSFEYKLFKEKIALLSTDIKASIITVSHFSNSRTIVERLNHVMMMCIHQDRKMNMDKAIDDSNSEHMRVFGKPKNLR